VEHFKPITIVGGGLAGLALGIALRQRSVPVVICEAGRYPRHRVCGEFISGRGQQTLERLGLVDLLMKAGARPAATAAFYVEDRGFPIRKLPREAWCLSRFRLDAVLADRFCKLGGELRCETRWQETHGSEGVVHANGRRGQATEAGWRWFGLKAHAGNVRLSADLEMHLLPDAYIGLCRLCENRVNICGLFRGRPEKTHGAKSAVERLRGIKDSGLHERLTNAEWVPESVCAVAGLSLRPRLGLGNQGCCVGDALTMIAPLTGNGMSMAFESAELSIAPILAYANGRLDWPQATEIIFRRCDALFTRRLRWAWWLQRCLFTPSIRHTILPVALRFESAWRFLFEMTR
jgi:flavin-dependent dehydrogenase